MNQVESGGPDSNPPSGQEALAIDALVKRFPGTVAVDDVSFKIESSTIHALVGENGAGKSTIIKILSGVYQPNSGHVLQRGKVIKVLSPHHAQELGITTIHQEQTLVDSLTVIENVFLGREQSSGTLGKIFRIVDTKAMRDQILPLCEDFDFDSTMLNRPVSDLTGLQKQIAEILKALVFRSEVIIMDEPTAGLTNNERIVLFRHMERLRERGTAVLWVTHRLEELAGLADRVTVLRDARLVGSLERDEIDPKSVVKMMIGRDVESIESLVSKQENEKGQGSEASENVAAFRVEGVTRGKTLTGVSFSVRNQEILGIGGLAGAGRTELVRAIIGADPRDKGSIFVTEALVKIRNTADALKAGIAYVPKERKIEGILPNFSVCQNITSSSLGKFSNFGLLDFKREMVVADEYISQLAIRTPSSRQRIAALSGGNQQKAIIARALSANPAVIIFNEPTQGVDIGAKIEIYKLINEYVAGGGCAVVVSSEMLELLVLSTRVIVMREGEIAGDMPGYRMAVSEGIGDISSLEEQFMALATNVERH